MTSKIRKKKEFLPKQLKTFGVGVGKVQKTLSLRQETHHALAYKAHELNLWESDVAEIAICHYLGIEPPPVPVVKSKLVENMGEKRKNPIKKVGLKQ